VTGANTSAKLVEAPFLTRIALSRAGPFMGIASLASTHLLRMGTPFCHSSCRAGRFKRQRRTDKHLSATPPALSALPSAGGDTLDEQPSCHLSCLKIRRLLWFYWEDATNVNQPWLRLRTPTAATCRSRRLFVGSTSSEPCSRDLLFCATGCSEVAVL
jgi:hypothetical protein